MSKVFVLYALLIIFFSYPIHLVGQSEKNTFKYAGLSNDYKFKHLTTEDGLPVNYCIQVLKDSQGFIWISTRAGLCRYDGYNMKLFPYDPLDSTSISDNRISEHKSMAEDTNGYLWVGTYNGLNRYNPVSENFKRYLVNPDNSISINNQIRCVYIDRKGSFWVSTANNGGLSKYIPETDNFRTYKCNTGEPGFIIPSINNMLEDENGVFWLGTDIGVFQFDRKKEHFIQVKMTKISELVNANLIRCIYEDNAGTMYFGTPYGFLFFDTLSNDIKPFSSIYSTEDYIQDLDIIDDPIEPHKTMWISSFTSTFIYNKSNGGLTQINHYPMNNTGILGATLSIYGDESDFIWMPGCFGVNIFNPGQIKSHILPDLTVEFQYPNCFLKDHNGHLWVGTENEYLLHYDNKMNLIKSYPSLPIDDETKSGGFQY